MRPVEISHSLKCSHGGKLRPPCFLTCESMVVEIFWTWCLKPIVERSAHVPLRKKRRHDEKLHSNFVSRCLSPMLTHKQFCLAEIFLTEILPAKGRRIIPLT